MKNIISALQENSHISDYKIHVNRTESWQLFFVKGKLETVRCTDNCDKEVTVYVRHGEFMGDSRFMVYPSTTEKELQEKIAEAAEKALLINNQAYSLPEGETGDYVIESNFAEFAPGDLAAEIASAVWEANTVPGASINSLEIFINKRTQTVANSRLLHKTQVKYDAMVEAIPTYNGEKQSVELYQQINFSAWDKDTLQKEIHDKLLEVKARYDAAAPSEPLSCPVVLNPSELLNLCYSIVGELTYEGVYAKQNLFSKGDAIQKEPVGDKLTITMAGSLPGSCRSSSFDSDGVTLGSLTVVEAGKAANFFGSHRFAQYLGEPPTGQMRCLQAEKGTLTAQDCKDQEYLEILSMSGLQVDFYTDYIGGEVRLAYHHHNGKVIPVTGISISGSLTEALNKIRLSEELCMHDGFLLPKLAWIPDMKIF